MGNVAEARRTAALALDMSTGREVSYAAAFALALTGELSRSQALLKDLEARFPQDTTVNISYLPALRGLIALNQGKLAEALKQLEPALSNEFALPGTAFVANFGSLYPAYVRGQTYMAARQPAEAAIEFQKIISHRGIVQQDPIDAVARLQLARALAASGDTAGARAGIPGLPHPVEAGRRGRSALEAGASRSGEASVDDEGPAVVEDGAARHRRALRRRDINGDDLTVRA